MVFAANPLSLSVPDPVFESWLRDSGYLEILDERSTATATAVDPSTPSCGLLRSSTPTAANFFGAFSFLRTLVSIFSPYPLAKLAPQDFSGETPSWTLSFVGSLASYSWPAGPSQARMRAHENVRRYARNYAFLSVLFLVCCLYQMPLSIVGLISSMAIWELLRYCSNVWEMEQLHPLLWKTLVRVALLATAVILYLCHLQRALIWAMIVSYIVMVLHASLRKLTPSKQNRHKGTREKKLQHTPK